MYDVTHVYSVEELIEKMKQRNSDIETARIARVAIRKEHDKRVESGSEFDVGFACGLSFALGAFSGVCEKKE